MELSNPIVREVLSKACHINIYCDVTNIKINDSRVTPRYAPVVHVR